MAARVTDGVARSRPTPPARTARRAALLAVAILAAACTGAPGTSGPGTSGVGSGPAGSAPSTRAPQSSLAPATPWQSELANLAPDGTRSAASALRLFAMAFGPLPGVDRPADPGPIGSGSLAVRAVRAHWSELSPDQQAAVNHYLGTPDGAVQGTVTATSITGANASDTAGTHVSLTASLSILRLPDRAAASQDLVVAFEQATLNLRSQIGAKLGGDNAGAIDVVLAPANDATGNFAYADPQFAGGRYASCRLVIFPKTSTAEAIVITNTIAHEVFHCFEAAGVDSLAAWYDVHDWWVEGGSEWVGDTLGGVDGHSAAFWPIWLMAPRNNLFTRTYDGEGFFAHLDQSGTSPWGVFPAIFRAGGDVARFEAAGGGSDQVLDSWASSVVRDPARGPAWDATGPGITDDRAAPEPISVGKSESDVGVGAYAGAVLAVGTSEDIVQVAFFGHARISDGSSDITSVTSAAFCTKQDGCPDKCPDGSPLPEAIPVLHAPFLLALSGGANGTHGTLQGSSLEDFCKPKPTPAPAVQVKDIINEFGQQITRVDLVSCDGPYGHWSGLFYGILTYSRPMSFYVGGSGDRTVTVTPDDASLPDNILSVSGDVDVTIKDDGTTMVLSGTTIAVMRGPNGPLPPDHLPFSVAYQIEPADPGRCP